MLQHFPKTFRKSHLKRILLYYWYRGVPPPSPRKCDSLWYTNTFAKLISASSQYTHHSRCNLLYYNPTYIYIQYTPCLKLKGTFKFISHTRIFNLNIPTRVLLLDDRRVYILPREYRCREHVLDDFANQ